MMVYENLEDEIKKVGTEFYGLMKGETPSVFNKKWWRGQVLEWSMKDDKFKENLFKFIDVLPSLHNDNLVLKYFKEYFTQNEQQELPAVFKWGIKGLPKGGFLSKVAAVTIRKNIESLSRHFIGGEDPKNISKIFEKFRKEGASFSADLLGEVVLSDSESKTYIGKYQNLLNLLNPLVKGWPHNNLLEMDGFSPIPRINISIKVSSLYSQLDPMNWEGSVEGIKNGLRQILREAVKFNTSLTVDMENYHLKDITIAAFKSILEEDEFSGFSHMGIAMQTYLKSTKNDLFELIEWAKVRNKKITIRLVKGAYWDFETALNKQKGWAIPVFLNKEETDYSFEELTKMMLENTDHIKPIIASHNIRNIVHAISVANILNLPPDTIEFQVLYGMAEPIKMALIRMKKRVRIYTPIGKLIPGMAYLVRRLIENTSNESFLRKSFVEKKSFDELIRPPQFIRAESVEEDSLYFKNEPLVDFSKKINRNNMEKALEKLRGEFNLKYPLYIGEKEVWTKKEIKSVNPAKPDLIVGNVASASIIEAKEAVSHSIKAFDKWRRVSVEERAGYLFKAAEKIRELKFDLAALMVFEVGKSWKEADGDVAEAIDFLEYYGKEMLNLEKPVLLGNYPGEANYYFYEPKGIGVVISPWNFPFAISIGMISASIVAGNSVIFKPSSLSPVIGAKLCNIFKSVGLPSGVLQFVPGSGKEIGEYLVSNNDINFITFTGSKEIGLKIIELAAASSVNQKSIKKVIAELGGKNAIIVDESADMDEALKGVLESALGYQGQKCSACSRVIVLNDIYDEFIKRLVEIIKSIKIGNPEKPKNVIGPVIDIEALKKIKNYIEIGKKEARLLYSRELEGDGYFVGPAIFIDVNPKSTIAQEEIFGPVISVIKAKDITEALNICNDTPYGLTGGIYSRSPVNIEIVKTGYFAGNLYINKKITGAQVGRQPFGGIGMSGIGSKAGGPDYLTQFLNPKSISENTIRKGFISTK